MNSSVEQVVSPLRLAGHYVSGLMPWIVVGLVLLLLVRYLDLRLKARQKARLEAQDPPEGEERADTLDG